MRQPARGLVAAQIDHEEPAAGHARPQITVTGDGKRGHIVPHSCLTVVLHVGMVEMVKQ